MHEFFHDVILHSLEETLLLLPFLYLTYLFIEWLAGRATDKTLSLLARADRFGPPVGALLGVVPQCGFSAVAANLYTAGVITVGTLLSVFLSTSDEMLPLLIGGGLRPRTIFAILGYKIAVAILVGVLTDFVLTLLERHSPARAESAPEEDEPASTPEACGCGCCCSDVPLWRAALMHTLRIGVFLLVTVIGVNLLFFLVGEDTLRDLLSGLPVLSHVVCALLGLVPNCAVSVLLSELYLSGVLSAGAMLAGLLPGAGVGLLVFCRVNRPRSYTLITLAILFVSGVLFGMLADAAFLAPLFAR